MQKIKTNKLSAKNPYLILSIFMAIFLISSNIHSTLDFSAESIEDPQNDYSNLPELSISSELPIDHPEYTNPTEPILPLESPNDSTRKIAVFMWASDAGNQKAIDKYKVYINNPFSESNYDLILEYKDNFQGRITFDEIDAIENANDHIFFFLWGHGAYLEDIDDSCVCLNGNTTYYQDSDNLYSSDLVRYIDLLEAATISILVESCESGGFVDDFKGSNVMVISTSSKSLSSWMTDYNGIEEGIFSHHFFFYLLMMKTPTLIGNALKDSYDVYKIARKYCDENKTERIYLFGILIKTIIHELDQNPQINIGCNYI
ncbi:MAG: hypothetical protein JXA99_06900 [Candidatus Lokiarchaeota archaeon]|nr:hypothetical protein [Candidatus Lokiarchaeota archaeon]